MPIALWTREISAAEFYESLETVCPKCRKRTPTETLQHIALASSALFDQCPACNTIILINLTLPDPVVFEGFSAPEDLAARMQELLNSR